MDVINENMDADYNIIRRMIVWAGQLERIPISFAQKCRFRLITSPKPYIEIYIVRGKHPIEFNVGTKHKTLYSGEIALANAHLGNSGTCPEWDYWCISLETSKIPLFDDIDGSSFLLTIPVKDKRIIVQNFNSIMMEYGRKGLFHETKIKIAILSLLLQLWENVPGQSLDYESYSARIKKAIEMIHTDYFNPDLELSSLAKAAHLSKDHFGRLFRKEAGLTPMKYLMKKRISLACELISRRNLCVKEIALQIGFNDPLHFSKVFHEYTGMCPRSYRAQLANSLQSNSKNRIHT
jgi:AraC-like DNA-binding protein